MQISREVKPMGVRLPPDLKQWLKERAASAGRSMNAELNIVLTRLRDSERQQQKQS